MSRRSRKRQADAKPRWFVRVIFAVLSVGFISLIIGYSLLRHYVHSDSFRKFLASKVSQATAVDGEFSPFRWQGLTLDTDGFHAQGSSLVSSIQADGLHTEVSFRGVRRGVWEIRNASAQRLEISIDPSKRPANKPAAPAPEVKTQEPKKPSWFPNKAELQSLDVADFTVSAPLPQGIAKASGISLHVKTSGKDSYVAEIEGGKIQLPFQQLPELRLERMSLRYQDGHAFLTQANLAAWASGRIQATGECDTRSHQFSLEGEATGLKCEDVFGADWAKRLTGDVASSFNLTKSNEPLQARGHLTLQNGTLTALPMLDALAAYADTRRFRLLSLSEAHTDWRWRDGEIFLTNLVLASDKLIRLEGSVTLRGREIDGHFRLGLAPGTLAAIPGAETDVFLPGEAGLLWAPLHLTGSLDNPKEDLTNRLITAAGMRMFEQLPETGEKVIKFSHAILGERSDQAVEKGVQFIEKNADTIHEVTDILGELLRKKDPKKR